MGVGGSRSSTPSCPPIRGEMGALDFPGAAQGLPRVVQRGTSARVDTVAEGRRQHLNQFRAAEPEGSGQDVWYDTGISWTAVTGWLFMH